jgi:hypothetical protein
MRGFFTSPRGFGLLGERSRDVRFSEARSTAMRFLEDVPVERALCAERFEVRDVVFGLGECVFRAFMATARSELQVAFRPERREGGERPSSRGFSPRQRRRCRFESADA